MKTILIICTLLGFHRLVFAQSSIPAGRWNIATLGIPHFISLQPSSNGFTLLNGTQFGVDQEGAVFSADGSYRKDNGQSGTYLIDANGGVTNHSSSGGVGFSQLASSRDIVAGVSDNSSSKLHLSVLLFEPETLAVGDLAGAWSYEQLEVPSVMTYSSGTGLSGGGLFNIESGDFEIQSDGTIPGIGSVSISGKSVQLHTGGSTDTFIVNRSKDVMIRVKADPNDSGQISDIMTILIRKPISLTQKDVAGTWRYFQMDVPLQMTLAGAGNSLSVLGGNSFEVEGNGEVFTLNPSGSVTIDSEGNQIPWSIVNGKIQLGSDPSSHPGSINASKNFIASAHEDSNVKIMTFFVRTDIYLSDTALTGRLELDHSITLSWPDRQEGFVLQIASQADGPWQSVSSTPLHTSHAYSLNMGGSSANNAYFRLALPEVP